MPITGRWSFWLDLCGGNSKKIDNRKIEKLLSVNVDEGFISAPDGLPQLENTDSLHYEELVWLLDLIEPKVDELMKLGVSFEDSSIWMHYEYFNQCNMEFDSIVLKRIGDLKLKLCVSCYEDKELVHRESFKGALHQSIREGVSLNTTIGIDVKVGDTFPIIIEIENERKNHSFILTSIQISEEFLKHFNIVNYSHNPKEVDVCPDHHILTYDCIINAKSKKRISLFLEAKEEGVFDGELTVYEGGQYITEGIVAVVENQI